MEDQVAPQSSSHQPAGYCPKCGYRMNPGRCPECGTNVPPNRLAKSAHAYKRYKEKIAALVILILVGAAIYAYRNVLPAVLPTSLLYYFYSDGQNAAARELLRRYDEGGLSATQQTRLFDLIVDWAANLHISAPYPSGSSHSAHSMLSINLPSGVPLPKCSLRYGPWEVCVDGKLALASPPERLESGVEHLGWGGVGLAWEIPALCAGRHEISVKQEVFLISQDDPDAAPLHTWTITASGIAVIEDPPIQGLYEPVLDEGVRQQVEKAVEIWPVADPCDAEIHSLNYRCGEIPVLFSSRVWARVTGRGDFHPISFTLLVRPGDGRRGEIPLDELPGIQSATHVDIRLIPCPFMADYSSEYQRYFGRTIERLGIPLRAQTDEDREDPP
ncbi:MAG: zinc ribbon domain-containing protein [Phycisphaerae bacterium]